MTCQPLLALLRLSKATEENVPLLTRNSSLVVFSALFIQTSIAYLQSSSFGTAIVQPIIWEEILLGYSLISATIPCLKAFVEGFTTGGVRQGVKDRNIGRYKSGTTFEMSWLKQRFQKNVSGQEEGIHAPAFEDGDERRYSRSRNMPKELASMNSQASTKPMIGISL